MNRLKKEEQRKHDAARKGLSADEVKAVDLEDELQKKVDELARKIHSEQFPEEYDFMYDSIADASERSRGINPMSQEYAEKINIKRAALGISQLGENGRPVSGDSYQICLAEAKKRIFSDINLKRPPDTACIFCNEKLKKIGGYRLVAQQLRGVTLSQTKNSGGNKDYPHQCVALFAEPLLYMVFWGEKEKWTDSSVTLAKAAYLKGKRPWFCQICGERKCTECGSPINVPVGSDILYGDGCVSHVGNHPLNPGCINKDCENYKNWPHKKQTTQ